MSDAVTANPAVVVKRFLLHLLQKKEISKYQLKVFRAIAQCRSAELGGLAMGCIGCGKVHYVLHRCRDRHCPSCQSSNS